MSVQQEHLNAAASLTKQEAAVPHSESVKADAAPQLEYNNPSRDSLAMLGAAVGGALLGVFLTLLILAIVNQGSIRFNTQAQIQELQATLVAVDQNVGALSANMNTLVGRLDGLQGQADAIPGIQADVVAAQDALTAQQDQLGQVNEAIAVLDVGRQKFDVFTTALTSALSEMSALDAPAVEDAAPVDAAPADEPQSAAPVEATADDAAAAEAAAPVEATADDAAAAEAAAPVEATADDADDAAAAEAAAPVEATADDAAAEAAAPAAEAAPAEAVDAVMSAAVVAASADVAADSIQVVYFADANGDGMKDAEEASVVGMSLNLVDAEGEIVATAETNEEGVALFSELAAGEYTLTTGEGDAVASVTVAEDAAEGQSVTVPVVE
jgi:uncharacterized coiled-coil protein SlyX